MNNKYISELKESVPAHIVDEAVETLKAYNEVFITREYGEWKCSTGICFKSNYPEDSLLYIVKAKEVFSKKEMDLNLINVHGEYPHNPEIKRDYASFREAIENKKVAVDIDETGAIIWE